VFDKDIKKNESKSSIEGFLETAVRNIPSFSIEGSGNVKITEEQRKNMEEFSCKFHGDFVLKEHPGNYEEAIVVYKALPGMLGEAHQNAVPIRVWLYPIDKLPLSSHTIKVRELEQSMLTEVTERLEEMEDFVRQCNDMIDTQVASNHQRIKRNVMNLKSKIEEYIIVFKEQMADLVPKIRDGSKLSGDLVKILEAKEKSPFNRVQLQKLIFHYAEEVNVLMSIQNLPNYCRDDGEFSAKLINDRQYMIGLVMQVSQHNDDYLEAMDQFLSTRHTKIEIPDIAKRNKWWRAGSPVLTELQRLSYILQTYHSLEETKEKQGLQSNVQFYVREQTMKEETSTAAVFLELYENGNLKEAKFDIPGESGKPTYDSVAHNQIELKWSIPTMASNRVVSYLVSAYVLNNTLGQTPCNHQMCLVDKINTVTNSATIENLTPGTEYFFQVSTNGQFGKTAVSLMSNGIETRKCPEGTYVSAGGIAGYCRACPPGSYSDHADATVCKECPMGTFSDSYGFKVCTPCPTGHYSDMLSGATDCKRCPGGTYSPTIGQKSITGCIGCPSGTYNPHPGQTEQSSCKKCGMGTYNANQREQQCYFCPFGTQSTVTGAKSMETCTMDKASGSNVNKAMNELKGFVQRNLDTIKTTAQRNTNELNKIKSEAGNFDQGKIYNF